MNLLEQYIKEVHSVKSHTAEWTKKFIGYEFLEIDVTTNCYGHIKRDTHIFTTGEWAEYEKQGYWMA